MQNALLDVSFVMLVISSPAALDAHEPCHHWVTFPVINGSRHRRGRGGYICRLLLTSVPEADCTPRFGDN